MPSSSGYSPTDPAPGSSLGFVHPNPATALGIQARLYHAAETVNNAAGTQGVSHGVTYGFVPLPAGNQSIFVSPVCALHSSEWALVAAGSVTRVCRSRCEYHGGSQLTARLWGSQAERVITPAITMFSRFFAA